MDESLSTVLYAFSTYILWKGFITLNSLQTEEKLSADTVAFFSSWVEKTFVFYCLGQQCQTKASPLFLNYQNTVDPTTQISCLGECRSLSPIIFIIYHTVTLIPKPHNCIFTCWMFLIVYPHTKLWALTLIVPSANSVSPLKIAIANRLIHATHKNFITNSHWHYRTRRFMAAWT